MTEYRRVFYTTDIYKKRKITHEGVLVKDCAKKLKLYD